MAGDLGAIYEKHGEKLRFLIVGAWNTLFSIGVLWLLERLVPYDANNVLQEELVLLANWVISVTQNFFTFKLIVFRTRGNWLREYMRMYITYAFTFAVQSALVLAISHSLGWTLFYANLPVIAVVTVMSYLGHKHFTFRQPEEMLGDTARPAEDSRARELSVVTGVYTGAWGLLLLASGRYWDDWAALDLSAAATREWSRQQGLFWQLDILHALSGIQGTERVAHVLAFVAYLVAAICLYFVLRAVPSVTARARVLLPALFAVFPVNSARYAIVDLMYGISLAVFMLAWVLVAMDLRSPSLWRKVAAGALLLFALLSTGSLLMFSAIIPLYVLWARWPDLGEPSARRNLAEQYGYLLALPVAGLLIRSVALSPSGLYSDYNRLTAKGLLSAFGTLPRSFIESLAIPLVRAFTANLGWYVLIVLAAMVLFGTVRLLLPTLVSEKLPSHREALLVALTGGLVFALGVYPYLAVGKMPQAAGWESRHQLLVPFGSALIVYGLVAFIVRALRGRPWVFVLASCIILGAFVSADLRISLAYQADWYKQVSLMQRMAEDPLMRENTYFIFEDRVPDLNANARVYRFYEYNGMMRMTFGDTTRFGVDESYVDSVDPLTLLQAEQYNCWQYVPTHDRTGVTIVSGDVDAGNEGVLLELTCLELFAPDRFDDSVKDIVRIETREMLLTER